MLQIGAGGRSQSRIGGKGQRIYIDWLLAMLVGGLCIMLGGYLVESLRILYH